MQLNCSSDLVLTKMAVVGKSDKGLIVGQVWSCHALPEMNELIQYSCKSGQSSQGQQPSCVKSSDSGSGDPSPFPLLLQVNSIVTFQQDSPGCVCVCVLVCLFLQTWRILTLIGHVPAFEVCRDHQWLCRPWPWFCAAVIDPLVEIFCLSE